MPLLAAGAEAVEDIESTEESDVSEKSSKNEDSAEKARPPPAEVRVMSSFGGGCAMSRSSGRSMSSDILMLQRERIRGGRVGCVRASSLGCGV